MCQTWDNGVTEGRAEQHRKRDEYSKILEKILKNYGIARNKPADCQ